jgi:purine-binding chemotaxis protein CheW
VSDVFDRLQAAIRALDHKLQESEEVAPEVLAERTARIAREAVSGQRVIGRAFLLFKRGGHRYGTPLERLVAVQPLASLTAVPSVPPFYLGVTNVRGEVIPVIDLPILLGGPAGAPTPRWVLQVGHDDYTCAVAVDEFEDLVELDQASLGAIMPTLPALAQRYGIGVTGDRVVLVDLGELIGDPSLIVDEGAA